MSAMQSRTDNSNLPFILSGESYANENGVIKQDGARAAILYQKTVMGKRRFSLATTGTANAGNTGNGTVTLVAKLADGKNLIIGNYNLECTGAGVDGRVAGSITADAGNTGNGTVTALAIVSGKYPVVGNWILKCKNIKNVPAAGTATADAGNTGDGTVTGLALVAGVTPKVGSYVLTCIDDLINDTISVAAAVAGGGNTGNGTVTLQAAHATGAPAKQGTWTLTCVEAVANGGRFSLVDPEGIQVSDQIAITGGAGGTALWVGAGITFTITDGGTDFVVGDVFTMAVSGAHGGKFELIDPDGIVIENDIRLPGTTGGTVVVSSGGITFTITDGATDFANDDFFTITVTSANAGLFTLTDPNGVDVKDDIALPGTPGGTVNVSSGGISFTITDGAIDFAVDDFFTLVISSAQGGVFKLVDPHTNLIASGLTMSGVPGGATTFNAGGMTFTVTDGSTDFIIGDKFNITVTSDSDYVPLKQTDLLGGANFAGIYMGENITAAAIVAGDVSDCPMIIGGKMTIDGDQLIFENSLALTSVLPSGKTVREEMEALGIFVESTIAIDEYENT